MRYDVKARSWHRLLGWALCAPLLVWAATGAIFLTKPGYAGAYHQLTVKTYPLTGDDLRAVANGTLEVEDISQLKVLKTAIGLSVLTTTSSEPIHWRINRKGQWTKSQDATRDELDILIEDAQSQWPQRYGTMATWNNSDAGGKYITDTSVELTLDWNTLRLQQVGIDTHWIDRSYRWHYLQWSGVAWIDRILGVVGLVGLIVLTLLGLRLLLKRPHTR